MSKTASAKPIAVERLPFLPLDDVWAMIRRPDAGSTGLLLPVPTVYADLLARAKAAGFHVRELYVVRPDVVLTRAGCWDAQTGDIWIQGGIEDRLEHLLHELAHASLHPSPPAQTLEEYSQRETETILRMGELARAWGLAKSVPPRLVKKLLREEEGHAEQARRVGYLIGTLDLSLVSRAEEALITWSLRRRWPFEEYKDALRSDDDSPLLDIDRSFLQNSGHIGDLPDEDPLGYLALPVNEPSGRHLRRALRAAAEQPVRATVHQFAPSRYISAGALNDDLDLGSAIQAAQMGLVGHFDVPPKTTWWCYGDSAAPDQGRLYRAVSQPPGKRGALEVWIWPGIGCTPELEAALQRYIRSWGRVCRIEVRSYAQGRRALDERVARVGG